LSEIKKHDAAALESGYATWHRCYEWGSILGTTAFTSLLVLRLAKCPPLSGWWVPLAALVGLLGADLTSGVVHWLFDTWGSVDTPIFGKVAIRTFRHHHTDQKAITRHDFVETNGHNFGLSCPVAASAWLSLDPPNASLLGVFLCMSAGFLVLFVSITSQVHKYAHDDVPPRLIGLLQRARLVLSPEHHAGHHAAPYNRNYCITVGWLNGPLRWIRFFETLEWLITAVTGAVPREDDIGKEAALRAAAEAEAEAARTEAEALVTRDG